jgi:mannose-1-phosphate guanylyltransferase
MSTGFWTVILAAGAGRRLASVTGGIPKQFWHLPGRPSLLDETIGRLAPLAPPARTIVVVDRSHRGFLQPDSTACLGARVLFQPDDRGTGAGILLALLPILEGDPDATVLLTPSDHGLRHPELFRQRVDHARRHVAAHPERVVLFGVAPDRVVADYGWISPEDSDASAFSRVKAFVEKPPADQAQRLFRARALWNTMVVVARAWTLSELFRRHTTRSADVFAAALLQPPAARDAYLDARYPTLPVLDFSRDVLTHAGDVWVGTLPAAIAWSDLGTPDRLHAWMAAGAGASSGTTERPHAAA